MWASDHELPGRVDVVFDLVIEKRLDFSGQFGFDLWDQYLNDVVFDLFKHAFILIELIVLGRKDDGVNSLWNMIVGVFNGHLALGIWAQVFDLLAFSSEVSQLAKQAVAKVECQRHIVFGFVRSVSKHHTLISCPLFFNTTAVDSLVDVGRLLVYEGDDAAAVTLKLVLSFGIANLVDGFPCDTGRIDIGLGFHFPGKNYLPRSDKRFAGHFRIRVESQEIVQQAVRNLICYLVGMPF